MRVLVLAIALSGCGGASSGVRGDDFGGAANGSRPSRYNSMIESDRENWNRCAREIRQHVCRRSSVSQSTGDCMDSTRDLFVAARDPTVFLIENGCESLRR